MFKWCCLFVLISQLAFTQEVKKVDSTSSVQDNINRVVQGGNAFGTELYAIVRTSSPENFCFSPYSVSGALAMPYAGSAGATQYQMQKVLHWQISSANLDAALSSLDQKLFSRVSETSDDFRFVQANSLWVQSGLKIIPNFQTEMEKYYRGAFRRTDFTHQTDTSRSDINSWVREKTFGKIPSLISQSDVNSGTRMVIVNTLYLKARWDTPFDPRVTHQEPFFADSDSTQSVPMMVMTSEFPYYKGNEFSIVELPYIKRNNTELAMLVFLPNQHNGLPALEKQFTSDKLQQWIAALKNQKIYILLPKFKITSSLSLNDPLEKLGMIDAFSDRADFSGITKNNDLKISNVCQKTFIAIDEAGTEAVAATAISIGVKSVILGANPIEFRVDHPFMYAIYDKATGALLFIGRCSNPGA